MSSPKTVLVLGAGASVPYGFPSGPGLKERIWRSIANHLDNAQVFGGRDQPRLGEQLVECGFQSTQLVDFATALSKSPRYSVDAFLENQPQYLDIGLTAIAAALLSVEEQEPLIGPRSQDDEDWYRHLYVQLGSTLDELREATLGVITFNYDRSFETYLERAVCSDHGLSLDEARAALAGIRVVHVHGSLGPHSYGTTPTPSDLAAAAAGIKVIGKDVDVGSAFEQARKLLWPAQRVCFLGFGYHPINVSRLAISNDWPAGSLAATLDHPKPATKVVTGTTHGLFDAEISSIRRLFEVKTLFPRPLRSFGVLEFLRATHTLARLHDQEPGAP